MNDIYTLAKSVAASKEDIRQAIINKKVNVDINEPLSAYAGKISEIRLASDYSDIVSVDAINYTGQDIKKGDKVWIVPNEISSQSVIKKISTDSYYSFVSRDGKRIYADARIYGTEDNSYIDNFNPLGIQGNNYIRWSEDNIYANDLSIINPRGVYKALYLCEGINLSFTDSNSKTFIITNSDLGKSITYTQTNSIHINSSYCCYDKSKDILFGYYSGQYKWVAYKIDWTAETVTVLQNFEYQCPYEFTSDYKFLLYYGNRQPDEKYNLYFAQVNASGNIFLYNPALLNEDFPNLVGRSNVYFTYNHIDDMLYLFDRQSSYIMAYKYYPTREKFELVNKVYFSNFAAQNYYQLPVGSADGKILLMHQNYAKIENNTKQYKATSTIALTNTENALSGIAEENATNNQSFKVGVALGPLTQLTVTSNTENAEITVE